MMEKAYNINSLLNRKLAMQNIYVSSGCLKKCILFPKKKSFKNETHVSTCQLLTLSAQEAVTRKAKNDETRDMAKLPLDYGL